jgi:hypothetical protein
LCVFSFRNVSNQVSHAQKLQAKLYLCIV